MVYISGKTCRNVVECFRYVETYMLCLGHVHIVQKAFQARFNLTCNIHTNPKVNSRVMGDLELITYLRLFKSTCFTFLVIPASDPGSRHELAMTRHLKLHVYKHVVKVNTHFPFSKSDRHQDPVVPFVE